MGTKLALAAPVAVAALMVSPQAAETAVQGVVAGQMQSGPVRSDHALAAMQQHVEYVPRPSTPLRSVRPGESAKAEHINQIIDHLNGRYPVPVQWSLIPPTQSTKDDPLDQYGIVGMKFTIPDGRQYGNWVRFSDVSPDGTYNDVFEEGKRVLLEQYTPFLERICPGAYFA